MACDECVIIFGMDMQNIEDEIDQFSVKYFQGYNTYLDDQFDFIQNNHLLQPKENYTIAIELLNKIAKHFQVLDIKFYSKTLKKLLDDIKNTQSVFDTFKQTSKLQKEIFTKEFIPSSPTLSKIAKTILELQNRKELDDEERLWLEDLKLGFKELKKVYFEVFSEVFHDELHYIHTSFMSILNTKSFYLDRLIWREARYSDIITKQYKVLIQAKKFNTKEYIVYTSGMMHPYSKEYLYLQSCLRIYK